MVVGVAFLAEAIILTASFIPVCVCSRNSYPDYNPATDEAATNRNAEDPKAATMQEDVDDGEAVQDDGDSDWEDVTDDEGEDDGKAASAAKNMQITQTSNVLAHRAFQVEKVEVEVSVLILSLACLPFDSPFLFSYIVRGRAC